MRVAIFILFAVVILFLGFIRSNNRHVDSMKSSKIEIRGIYGSPEPFWKKNFTLPEVGVNAIFMHAASINESIMERAKSEGIKVFAEFPTLNGKGYVEEHPEAWAIDANGNKVGAATWFMGVCPSESGFKKYRMDQLEALLRKFDLDGVWMDYLHWHAQFEDPDPILPETCFCDHCLKDFQSASQIHVPDGNTKKKAEWILANHDDDWRNWRCSVIASWVRDFRKVMKKEKPDALLGVYHCPWDDNDFNGARRSTLGLDYDSLRDLVDVFSPMVYHGRMGKHPIWVRENIEWFSNRLKIKPGSFPKVWPIVQAYNDPKVISAQEFEQVLLYGVSANASGVMMFTSQSVAEDDSKIRTMKKVYTSWGNAK